MKAYSETSDAVMMNGVAHGYAYGQLMPLRSYVLNFTGCQHTYDVVIPSHSPIGPVETLNGPCHKCYTGPTFNVFD